MRKSETLGYGPIMTTPLRLILASASPRRRQLLSEAGYQFEVDPSGIDEPEPQGPIDVRRYVADLAWRKAFEVAARHPDGLILAADTACEIDGEILNKPSDRDDAERMIRLQEGRDTRVVTGFTLFDAERFQWLGSVESSVVRFRMLTDAERTEHLDSGRWQGKAGAYGVQDNDPFLRVIAGSPTNVVGLPMEKLAEVLRDFPQLRR